eukprot:SAG31_NODE_5515_length_2484_cov_4.819287_3_plen_144_part_00
MACSPAARSQVFPRFLEACTDHLAEGGTDLSGLQDFRDKCLDIDGLQIVEYAIMLLDRGCVIDIQGMPVGRRALLGSSAVSTTRRRQQNGYLAQHLSSLAEGCTWDQVDDLAVQVAAALVKFRPDRTVSENNKRDAYAARSIR